MTKRTRQVRWNERLDLVEFLDSDPPRVLATKTARHMRSYPRSILSRRRRRLSAAVKRFISWDSYYGDSERDAMKCYVAKDECSTVVDPAALDEEHTEPEEKNVTANAKSKASTISTTGTAMSASTTRKQRETSNTTTTTQRRPPFARVEQISGLAGWRVVTLSVAVPELTPSSPNSQRTVKYT